MHFFARLLPTGRPCLPVLRIPPSDRGNAAGSGLSPYTCGNGTGLGMADSIHSRLIKGIDDPRVAVCFDTQHVWASGYDVASKSGLADTVAEFDQQIGVKLLRAVHLNDSKTERGSAVDRHDNIGEGLIGKAGFANILKHPVFGQLPGYLEVPGFDGTGPDKKNVDILKATR